MGDHPDLTGLCVAVGGITGALLALRDEGLAGKIAVVGHQLMDVTCAALLDDTLSLAISHPIAAMAETMLRRMVRACAAKSKIGNFTTMLPVEICARENI